MFRSKSHNNSEKKQSHLPLALKVARLNHAFKDKKKGVSTIDEMINENENNQAFLNNVNKEGESIFTWAVKTRNFRIVHRLLMLEAFTIDMNFLNENRAEYAALASYLFSSQDIKVCLRLVNQPGFNFNLVDPADGRGIIFGALKTKNLELINCFLRYPKLDLSVNSGEHTDGDNILTYTARFCSADILKVILADPRCKTLLNVPSLAKGVTALMWAIWSHDEKAVDLLLDEKDIDLEALNHDQQSALSVAAGLGLTKTVERIIQKLKGDNQNDELIKNAGLAAATHEKTEVLQLFIRYNLYHGVDLFTWADTNKNEVIKETIINELFNSPQFNPFTPLPNSSDTYVTWAIRNKKNTYLTKLMNLPLFEVNAIAGHISTFCVAVECGRIELARKLFDEYAFDVNSANNNGDAVLHVLAKNCDVANTRLFLEKFPEAKRNIYNTAGDFPIHIAIHKNNYKSYEYVQECINQKTMLNVLNKDGRTPLHLAIIEKNGNCATPLAHHPNMDVNIADNAQRTPLISAVLNQDVALVRILLSRREIDVRHQDNLGKTALMYAAELGSVELVNLLLTKADADLVNMRDNEGHNALALLAKFHDKVGIARELIKAGSNCEANTIGKTPDVIATDAKHYGMAGFLSAYAPPLRTSAQRSVSTPYLTPPEQLRENRNMRASRSASMFQPAPSAPPMELEDLRDSRLEKTPPIK